MTVTCQRKEQQCEKTCRGSTEFIWQVIEYGKQTELNDKYDKF